MMNPMSDEWVPSANFPEYLLLNTRGEALRKNSKGKWVQATIGDPIGLGGSTVYVSDAYGNHRVSLAREMLNTFSPCTTPRAMNVKFRDGNPTNTKLDNLEWEPRFEPKTTVKTPKDDLLPGEEWRMAPNSDGFVMVSNLGRFKTKDYISGEFKLATPNLTRLRSKKWLEIKGWKSKETRFRLNAAHMVLITFSGNFSPPARAQIRFLDGNIENVAFDNLKWEIDNLQLRESKAICMCLPDGSEVPYDMKSMGRLLPSICWNCARASDSSCSWSRNFTPVKGWKAVKCNLDIQYSDTISYNVITCPEFIPDRRVKKSKEE